MLVIRGSHNYSSKKPSVIAIGNFDGVHIGHQNIISIARQLAQKDGLDLLVLTFEPHPTMMLNHNNGQNNFRLLPIKYKLEKIAALGVDFVIIEKFHKDFASLSPEEFIKKILLDNLNAKYIVVGENFVFGKNRAGNIKLLESILGQYNSSVISVPLLADNNQICSSSNIRTHLASGNIATANELLGYNFFIIGTVIHGQKLGRILQVPTANIITDRFYRPKYGVYAVQVKIGFKIYNAIANIGIAPTINNDSNYKIEVHIFDFDEDLYGQKITIYLHSFIREEQKFSDIDLLKQQIQLDCQIVRNYFQVYSCVNTIY